MNKKGGFTLIELMVSISIMTIITTMVLLNYPKFNSKISLQATAGEMALSIREAQVYGVATKSLPDGTVPVGYGINFDLDISNTEFTLFADLPTEDNAFAGRGTSEDLRRYTIKTNLFIRDMCINKNGSITCNIKNIDIVYNRPLLLAIINNDATILDVEIKMENQSGQKASVTVYNNGQIKVN